MYAWRVSSPSFVHLTIVIINFVRRWRFRRIAMLYDFGITLLHCSSTSSIMQLKTSFGPDQIAPFSVLICRSKSTYSLCCFPQTLQITLLASLSEYEFHTFYLMLTGIFTSLSGISTAGRFVTTRRVSSTSAIKISCTLCWIIWQKVPIVAS